MICDSGAPVLGANYSCRERRDRGGFLCGKCDL